jgi:hypothetical protein
MLSYIIFHPEPLNITILYESRKLIRFSEEPMCSSHICYTCDMFSTFHQIWFNLSLPQYQKFSSALCFESLQFMFFVSTDTRDSSTDTQGDSFGTRPKKMRISQRLFIRLWINFCNIFTYKYIYNFINVKYICKILNWIMNNLWDIRIFLGLVTKESPCIIHSNEKNWPSVDLGAGWITLTQTGCNLKRTIDTVRCKNDRKKYKKNIRLFGNLLSVWSSSGSLLWSHYCWPINSLNYR